MIIFKQPYNKFTFKLSEKQSKASSKDKNLTQGGKSHLQRRENPIYFYSKDNKPYINENIKSIFYLYSNHISYTIKIYRYLIIR